MTRKKLVSKSFSLMVILASAGLVLPARALEGAHRNPASVDVSVAPAVVDAGGQATVTVKLVASEGVKINRYPKIKLSVPGVDGIVEPAEVSVGNSSPPHPENPEANYFEKVDPILLDIVLDPGAPGGSHEIEGRLSYFYCVLKSGYCAPARAQLKIPITVR